VRQGTSSLKRKETRNEKREKTQNTTTTMQQYLGHVELCVSHPRILVQAKVTLEKGAEGP
jgi:hypothetical protein